MITAHITDSGILRAIDPGNIAIYLSSRGWMPEEVSGGNLWVLESNEGSAQIFVPASNGMRGYVGFMRDVLGTLSDLEGRSEFSVLEQINLSLRDIQYVRTQPPAEPGTIALNDGARVYDSVRQWISAAAVSVSARRASAVQPRRKSSEVVEFLRNVRLGATYPGSFVLSVQIPVPPEIPHLFSGLDHPALNRDLIPFNRKVSLRLHEASESAIRAAGRVLYSRSDISVFEQEVQRGVTANLCESLVGLGGEDGHPFSISFDWATARPVERREEIDVTPGHITVLREAANMLRQAQPEEDISISGNVVRLHREGNLGPGEVSILGTIEGDAAEKMQRIWLELDEQDYRLATAAHERGVLVSVKGNLLKRGNRSILQQPRGFTVSEELVD